MQNSERNVHDIAMLALDMVWESFVEDLMQAKQQCVFGDSFVCGCIWMKGMACVCDWNLMEQRYRNGMDIVFWSSCDAEESGLWR